jgi:putative salt-induced outer membrane protein
MKTLAYLAGATVLAASFAVPAFAQSESSAGANAVGITKVNEGMKDIERDVRDEFARSDDAYRFGNPEQRQGTFGSIALSYAGATGNSENQDFSLSGRLSHNQGQFSQSVGILLQYGDNNAGNKDTEKTFVIYEGMYNINDRFYGFALGRLATDALAGDPISLSSGETFDSLNGRLKRDAYLGFGPGYRVINSETTAWRVQAAVGVRYTKAVVATEDATDTQTGTVAYDSNTDVGYLLSSRFYHRVNDNLFVTNDTDYLTSDANDTITNELGLNFKVTDAFATRVSYKTEYVSDRNIRTDNTLGVSLVYGF